MITITDVDSPFDDLESPITAATPSCCCCCCCCLATLSSATVLTARVVRRDAAEGPNARSGHRSGWLIAAAATLPIVSVVIALRMLPADSGRPGMVWVILGVLALLFAAILAQLRIRAGADVHRAWAMSALMVVLFPLLLVAEVFVVLFTVGLFWLSIPLWIVLVVKQTKLRRPPTEWAEPVAPATAYTLPPPPIPGRPDDETTR